MSGDAHTTAPSPTSTTTYAFADPSPASLQGESTLLSFVENLSPMKSDKRARYVQRFSMSSFPISQPVFDSPTSSDEIHGSGGDPSKSEGGGIVQEATIGDDPRSCSPTGSACVDQYLADLLPSVAVTSDAYEYAETVYGVDCQQSEHGQHQHDIRRHLQFESVQATKNSSDETHDMTNFTVPDRLEVCSSSSYLDQIPAHDEPQVLSSIQDENCGQNLISRSYYFPSSTFTPPRSMSLLTTSSRHSAGNLIAQEEKMATEGTTLLPNDLHNISLPSAVGAFHALLDSGLSVSRDTSSPGPANLAVDILQHSSALQFTQLNIQLAPSQSSHPSQSFDGVEALNQMTPERIRKRSRNKNETKGCKYCNCKRTRCLKLYCECFSAGLYCDNDCSCENCLNKADFEDTVNDIRKQIELRNPHAFAPKVVEQVTGSPAITMENQTTPSSARHKRGCNCKKSKCVKKYCECYQAHVGCSEGCRCENCKNHFGTKAEVIHRRTVNQENQYTEQLDVLKTQNQYSRMGRSNPSSPTWEPLSDISNLAPLSHPSLAGHRSMQFTPTRFTPKFDGSQSVENFTSMLHNVVYAAPPVVDHSFAPRKTSKAGSSNEINASPVHGLRSSLSQVSRSGCKFSSFALEE